MHDFFYGWYLKCQSETQTLGVIPAIHNTGNKRTCSIQVITDNDAKIILLPINAHISPDRMAHAPNAVSAFHKRHQRKRAHNIVF